MAAYSSTIKDRDPDRFWPRFGAVCLITGSLLLTWLSFAHPHQSDPNDNPAVFAEYSAAPDWFSIHLGQYLGGFLISGIATLAIYRSLAGEGEQVANWARLGLLTAWLCLGVFTIDQTLDGIALKRAVDAWSAAPGTMRDSYFATAEALRWLEYGLNGMYNLTLGASILFISTGIAFSTRYPHWLGWDGLIAGTARILVGVATMTSGFSPLVGVSGLVAFIGGTLWGLAMTYLLWKLPATRQVKPYVSAGTVFERNQK